MVYRLLADATVLIHFGFILFVVLGGFLVFRWPRLAWVHVPAFLWGAAIELIGWRCPLTDVENALRRMGAEEGYQITFVERYLIPVIYPELLFPGGFPPWGFTALGIFVLAVNAAIYWRAWRKGKVR